jgi:hypothetical protein
MFQLFLRARAHKYFKNRRHQDFRARSADRDAETDRARISSILAAVENALQAAQEEHEGLSRRVQDVLGRAAVTMGNATDEYLDREPLNSRHQDLFGIEISNGQRRLEELATTINHLKFLKAALLSRFPALKPNVPATAA